MHNTPVAVIADYTWPTCVACSRELWQTELGRWACHLCEERTAKHLRALPVLFARINSTSALVRGARRSPGMPTGSKVPPIPANVEVLSLAAVGGVATRLQGIEDAWRKELGWTVAPWRGNAGQAVPKLIQFLTNNLPWACERYEPVGQDVEEIRRLHSDCTTALSPDPKPSRVRIGLCPKAFDSGPCGAQLTATVASPKVRCPQCRTEWPDMGAWRELRRAQEAAAEQVAKTGIAA